MIPGAPHLRAALSSRPVGQEKTKGRNLELNLPGHRIRLVPRPKWELPTLGLGRAALITRNPLCLCPEIHLRCPESSAGPAGDTPSPQKNKGGPVWSHQAATCSFTATTPQRHRAMLNLNKSIFLFRLIDFTITATTTANNHNTIIIIIIIIIISSLPRAKLLFPAASNHVSATR